MRERERYIMYQYPNYLEHYGVLGMKWGQHRARRNAAKAKNTKNRAKAKQYAEKAKALEKKHTARAGSKEVYNRVKNQSTAKLVGKSLLMGTYGTLNYERLQTKNKSKGLSFAAGLGSQIASGLSYHALEVVEPRFTATGDYKKVKQEAASAKNKLQQTAQKMKSK